MKTEKPKQSKLSIHRIPISTLDNVNGAANVAFPPECGTHSSCTGTIWSISCGTSGSLIN